MAEEESIPSASDAAAAEAEKEETPVIDVHAPHGGVHTWKDFWIHLGTITLGLLIAISLEQSVEWMHHREERHQLEEDLHAEDLRDHDQVQADLRAIQMNSAWVLNLRDRVDRMHASGGKLKLTYPPKPLKDPVTNQPMLATTTIPSDSVWSTATESGLVVLLPRAEAELYARHARQHDYLVDEAKASIVVLTDILAFEDRFDDAGPMSTPDLSRMSDDDLAEYSRLLSRDLAVLGRFVARLNNFDGQTQRILAGARTEQELIPAQTR